MPDRSERRLPSIMLNETDSEGEVEEEETDYSMKNLFKLVRGMDKKIKAIDKKMSLQFVKIKEDMRELRIDVDKNKVEINESQQYLRNSSMRVYGLKLDPEHKSSVINLLKQVHSTLFEPILQAAVDAGEIAQVPDAEFLLEYGHTLPNRKAWSPPTSKPGMLPLPEPIIVRFNSRV